MISVIKGASPANRKNPPRAGAGIREQELRIRYADNLIDTIQICLNAHIHGVSAYSLDDTVQSIVQEIKRYKSMGMVS